MSGIKQCCSMLRFVEITRILCRNVFCSILSMEIKYKSVLKFCSIRKEYLSAWVKFGVSKT